MVRIGGTPPGGDRGEERGQYGHLPPPPPPAPAPAPEIGTPLMQGIAGTCSTTRGLFVLRLRQVGDEVVAVEGQKVAKAPPATASTTYSTQMPVLAEDYPGCPHCGNRGVIGCGSCSAISCSDAAATSFTCPSCGNSGVLGHADVNLRLDGWQ